MCCNYYSGFCTEKAANFPCGNPETGGKPELSQAISSTLGNQRVQPPRRLHKSIPPTHTVKQILQLRVFYHMHHEFINILTIYIDILMLKPSV